MTVSADDAGVNREKTCPLLLRMFYSAIKHNNVIEYQKGRTPSNELQVYTWLDATLRELASLVKQVNPESRRRGTVFDFALVSADTRSPSYRMRELGAVCSGFPSDTDRIMLKDCQFVIGDMIDVAITPPATEASYFHPVEIGTVEFMRTVKRDSPTGALFYSRSGARHTGDFGSRSSARYGRPYEGSRRVVTYDSEVTGKSFDNASVDNRRDRRRAYEEREPRGRRVVPY